MFEEDRKFNWNYETHKPKQDPYELILPKLNKYTSKQIREMPEQEVKAAIDEMIAEIRKINLFPIYYYSDAGIEKEIKEAAAQKVAFNPDDTISVYSARGLTLLDFLFPNLHQATSKVTRKSALDVFYDDKKLGDCLYYYLKERPITNLRAALIQKMRLFYTIPVNYSPMRAKAIFERFCPAGGIIYDYSAGYGARMLGALSSKRKYKYICTDPNRDTYYSLLNLGYWINRSLNRSNTFEIYNQCSENLKLVSHKEKIDFAFSCPPFFNIERYSDEPTQSIIKFPKYEDWLEGYVRETIKNCIYALKKDGIFGVDMIKTFDNLNLADNWIEIAEEEGLYLKGVFPIISKKTNSGENEALYIFTKNPNIELQNYTNKYAYEQFLKTKERNKLTGIRRKFVIAVYDIWGKLIETFPNCEKAGCKKEDLKSKKPINNKYFRIYRGNDKILEQIEVKKPALKVEDTYFLNMAEAAKFIGVTRQAVSFAKINKSDYIKTFRIKWFSNKK